MNWLILMNFIGALISLFIIWRGFVDVNSHDLILGVILLIMNVSCVVFNLARKLFDK